MTKKEAKFAIQHVTNYEVWGALEFMRNRITARDVPHLVDAYPNQRETIIKVEIVELVALINSDDSVNFLVNVARSRTHWLVRYYAMRSLIDFGRQDWRPKGKLPTSDFYASLEAYESFVKGDVGLVELQEVAKKRSTWNADHWHWLLHLR